MSALLGSLPFEAALGLIAVESSFTCREVKHKIVSSVTVDIFDVAAMCRSCAAIIGNDVGGSEPIPGILTCRIELVGLQDSNRYDPMAVRIDRVVFTSWLDIDRKAGRKVPGGLPTE